jgi:vacuole morphology and inheritance protein 14
MDIKPEEFRADPGKFGSATYKATCHSWFIVKDKGVPINWRKPLLQKS